MRSPWSARRPGGRRAVGLVGVLFFWLLAPIRPAGAVAPVADAGGPYVITEGQALTLDASGSSDGDGDPLTYTWDLDADGQDDAIGQTPTVPWSLLSSVGVDDDGSYVIILEVYDGTSTSTDTTTLTVTNAAPTVAVLGEATARAGSPYELTVEIDDPGADTVASWVITWGDGEVDRGVGSPGTRSHTYSTPGMTPGITVEIADEDGTWNTAEPVVAFWDSTEKVSRFEATTGAKIADLAPTSGALGAPYDVVLGPDGLLYVSGMTTNSVVRFDPADNGFVDTFVAAGSGGLSSPKGIGFGPDGNLYVVSSDDATIKRYDGETGTYIDDFVAPGTLTGPQHLLWQTDGSILVSDGDDDDIHQFSGSTGAPMGVFATANPGDRPVGLTLGPNGNLFVAMYGTGLVREYDGSTGVLVGDLVTSGLSAAHSLEFGPDGELWVTDYMTEQVKRFDAATGAALGVRITEPIPAGPFGIEFLAHRQVRVSAGLEVNSTGDASDDNVGDGVCRTGDLNAANVSECTLRAAIEEANAGPEADLITFDIPVGDSGHSGGVWTIGVAGTAYPWIDQTVTIDATSAPSYTDTPVIVVDGSALTGTETAFGLTGAASDSTVRGLSIVSFPDDAVSTNADRVTIADNFLGVLPDGVTAPGNGSENVAVFGGTGTTIEENLIGGATNANVAFTGTTDGLAVRANTIGTDQSGSLDFGGAQGIWTDASGTNLVGGPEAGDGNVIANSAWDNIEVDAAANTVTILGNEIRDGGDLGIDLSADGVTANDPDDADTGPNRLLNYPVPTAAVEAAGVVDVSFDLDVPAGTYRIEVFDNPAGVDPSGNGEGQAFAGSGLVLHPGGGPLGFTIQVPGITVGDLLTTTATEVTATSSYGATSEFSVPVTVAANACGADSDGDGLCDAEEDADTDADNNPATNPGPDPDGDTTPNYLDDDDDGDGIPTASEKADPNGDGDPRDAVDSDHDGQADWLDPDTAGPSTTPVADEQKISDTVGGLAAALEDDDRFGTSAAGIGDVDGDGVNDLAAGAPRDDDGGSQRGAVYVLFLNADGTVKAEQKISDTVGGLTATLDDNDQFGLAVTSVGDLDGDGVPDLAVGASLDDDGGSNAGATYILFLNTDGTVKAEQKISDTVGGLTATLTSLNRFGGDLAPVGDLDGDGIVDLAVSAFGDADGGSYQGAVFVLFLNPDGTVKAEQKISETQGGFTGPLDGSDEFGLGLTSLGDLDGDGVIDLAVGARNDDDAGTDAGAAYILFLNSDGTVKAEQKIVGEASAFGIAVAGLGDLDGDGVVDLAARSGVNGGTVHLLALNTDGTVKSEQRISSTDGALTGQVDGGGFGRSITVLGDLDGDGATNLAIGGANDDDGGTDRGALHLIDFCARVDADGDGLWDCAEDADTDADNNPATNPGPDTDGDTTPNYLDDDDDGDGLATALENADPNADGDPRDAVDSDRDGHADWLDPAAAGLSSTPVAAEQKISDLEGGLVVALEDSDGLGASATGIGDLDGDGVNDAAVGLPSGGALNTGKVLILFLNADGTVKAEQEISAASGGLVGPLSNSDFFGTSLANLGDLDGDGINDLAVGADGDDDGGPDKGAVYILFLNPDGTVKGEQKISDIDGGLAAQLTDSDFFGKSLSGTGDLDGDGINDLAVGADGDDDGGPDKGAVYILFLNADGTVKAEQKISEAAGGLSQPLDLSDRFGGAIDGIGDLDGDGVQDLAVGAFWDDDGGNARGAVYVLLLEADGTVKGEQKISDTSGGLTAQLDDNDTFGLSVAGAGDLDDDGTPDIVVGATGDDDGGNGRGAVYLLNLNADGTVKAEEKISATSGGLAGPLDDLDLFGRSVAGLGDLDEDGQADLMVGAYGDDDGGAGRGAVYVLDLSPTVPPTVVNSTADVGDGVPGDGVCDTGGLNTESQPECTIRAAIEEANASGTIETIGFDIPVSDPNHLYYRDDAIADSLGTPTVTALDDASITDFDTDYPLADFSWWRIQPASPLPVVATTVTIDGYTQPGSSAGTTTFPSTPNLQPVIEIDGSLISGNEALSFTSTGNLVRGLVINGQSTSGSAIWFQNASQGSTVQGSIVGLDPTGTVIASSAGYGVEINAAGTLIGGTGPGEGNVISGNSGYGLWIDATSTVQGNLFGTDITGMLDRRTASTNIGVVIGDGTFIGGAAPGAGNLISAHEVNGIWTNSTPNGVTIQGNRIGTTLDLSATIPSGTGINVNADNVLIGGTAAGSGNVIGGITNSAVTVSSSGAGTVIEGNDIGTDPTGATPLPNNTGVYVAGSPTRIGGSTPGAGNRIANSFSDNVRIFNVSGVSILGNSIYGSDDAPGDLGIDLETSGVDLNDVGDVDTGANDLLNFPEVTAAQVAGGTVTVQFGLDVPAGTYRVEAFTNPSGADFTGYGEGESFQTFATITHTGTGVEPFQLSYAGSAGDVVTLTTTEDLGAGAYGSTSEFSAAVTVTAPSSVIVNSSGDAPDLSPGDDVCDTGGLNSVGDPECTLRAAIEEANASATIDTIGFDIPESDPNHLYYRDDAVADSLGTPTVTALDDASIVDFDPDYPAVPFSWWQIVTSGGLPAVTSSVTIDGTTQPGWRANTATGGDPRDVALPIVVTGDAFDLLTLNGSGSTVRGMNFSGGNSSATVVALGGTGGHVFEGSWAQVGPVGATNSGLGDDGVYVAPGSDGNRIGGPNPEDHVLIGNGYSNSGLNLASDANTVQNLWIGAQVTGDALLPGHNDIPLVIGGNDNVVGTVGAGVVVSSSLNDILIVAGDRNRVQASSFGHLPDGTISDSEWASVGGNDNLIGGASPGEGNRFQAGDSSFGSAVYIGSGTGNSLLGNTYTGSTDLVIDLGPPSGPNTNDTGDVDAGTNDLLNHPIITLVTPTGATATVDYQLDVPAGDYRVEFYADTTEPQNASGYGAGQALVGIDTVTHTGSGIELFSATITNPPSYFLAATTSESLGGGAYGSTSEFGPTLCVGDADGDGLCDRFEELRGDTDGDGLVNELDADDDGDGTPTASESADPNADGNPRDALDSDRDGQADYLDPEAAGPSSPPVAAEQKISSLTGGLTAMLDNGDQFGTTAAIGDLDGDGVVDLAVGEDGGDAIHVLFLNVDGTVKTEQEISPATGGLTSPVAGSGFGAAIANAGDLNGDGTNDLVVGLATDDDGGANRGAVLLLFLNPDGTVMKEQKISSTQGGLTTPLVNNGYFGTAVAGLGDLDGDGTNDVAVGGNDDGVYTGAVYVLFLNSDGTVKAEQLISSTQGGLVGPLDDYDNFGNSVANIGDLNGDGTNDMAVGAWFDNDGSFGAGAVYVLFLNPDGTVSAEQKISSTVGGLSGPLPGDQNFGTSVAGLGDINGDNNPDIAVGATRDGIDGQGELYLLSLEANGTVGDEARISSTLGGLVGPVQNGDYFAAHVAGLGDLDGDGSLNLAIGSPGDDTGGDRRGAVYIVDLSVAPAIVSAVADSGSTTTATATVVDVVANDADADAVTVIDLTDPANGTASAIDASNVTYTSDPAYVGIDTFDYWAIDAGASLAHYWGLATGGLDSVGSADGVLTGTTPTAGDFGPAITFDEVDDSVVVPDFAYSSEFTISFEFKIDDNTGSLFQYLYSHGDPNTNDSINVFLSEASHGTDPNVLRTVVRDADDTLDNLALQVDVAPLIGDGLWHTYSVTVGAAGIKVYLDGVRVASDSTRGTGGVDPSGSLLLGAQHAFDPDRFYGGSLDSVQIYGRALTSSEVADLSNETNIATVSILVAGLVDPPGAAVYDESVRRSDVVSYGGFDPTLSGDGVAGFALDFNGGTERLVGPSTEMEDSLTLSTWVNLDGWGVDPHLVAKTDTAGAGVYDLSVDSATGAAVMRIDVGGVVHELRGGTLSLGTWHSVTATWDGTMARLYLDGVEVASTVASGELRTDLNLDLTIGNTGDRLRGLDGRLDQIELTGLPRSADWIATRHANLVDASFVSVGGRQTGAPGSWTVDASARTGSWALAAPDTANGAEAWATATGIDEPGIEYRSFWYLNDPSAVLAAGGTRTGAVPITQNETAIDGAGWDLGSVTPEGRTQDAPPAGGAPGGVWVEVIVRTDELGRSSVWIDGVEVHPPTVHSTGAPSGSVGLRVGTLPPGDRWLIDDVRLRRLVSDEPTTTLGPIERN